MDEVYFEFIIMISIIFFGLLFAGIFAGIVNGLIDIKIRNDKE